MRRERPLETMMRAPSAAAILDNRKTHIEAVDIATDPDWDIYYNLSVSMLLHSAIC